MMPMRDNHVGTARGVGGQGHLQRVAVAGDVGAYHIAVGRGVAGIGWGRAEADAHPAAVLSLVDHGRYYVQHQAGTLPPYWSVR